MTRFILHGLALLVILGAATVAHAESVSEEAYAAASDAGLDPAEVQGAANSTGMHPYEYLYAVGHLRLPAPVVSALAIARVRLTYYLEGGVTASGQQTRPGTTACSYNWAFGTRFRFPNGEIFTCTDRGRLGNGVPVGWLDLWRRGDLARLYGPYVTVEVLPR